MCSSDLTARLAHGLVLGDDVGVLYGHIESAEGADEGAHGFVARIETGTFILLHGIMSLCSCQVVTDGISVL